MARNKEPVAIIQAKGKSHHLTKAEIAAREAAEVKPVDGEIIAPSYLTKKQVERFYSFTAMLGQMKVLGASDVEAIARYVCTIDEYWTCVKMLRKKEVRDNLDSYCAWADRLDKWDKMLGRLESKLGFTPVDRCKLSAPAKKEEPKVNRFAKFSVTERAANDD